MLNKPRFYRIELHTQKKFKTIKEKSSPYFIYGRGWGQKCAQLTFEPKVMGTPNLICELVFSTFV